MRLYTINTKNFKLDGGAMFGVVPKSIWNKLTPADENNLCSWSMRCMLVEEGKRLILIDNGIGDKQDAKFFSYYYLFGEDSLEKSLSTPGFHPDDITDVILTHLHFDHCGGSIIRSGDKLIPAFKNAVYWSNEKHWLTATVPNDREKASFFKENILPIKESGQLKMIPHESPIASFTENIELRFVHGHTEAMMIPLIRYGNRTVVFVADLFPSVFHLPIPYIMSYDLFPLTTMQEKKSFLQEALEKDYILFFEHDLRTECCTLQRTDRGIRQKDLLKLSEI